MLSNNGQRLNKMAHSIYLRSIANYVIDPEIGEACEAVSENVSRTPTH